MVKVQIHGWLHNKRMANPNGVSRLMTFREAYGDFIFAKNSELFTLWPEALFLRTNKRWECFCSPALYQRFSTRLFCESHLVREVNRHPLPWKGFCTVWCFNGYVNAIFNIKQVERLFIWRREVHSIIKIARWQALLWIVLTSSDAIF